MYGVHGVVDRWVEVDAFRWRMGDGGWGMGDARL